MSDLPYNPANNKLIESEKYQQHQKKIKEQLEQDKLTRKPTTSTVHQNRSNKKVTGSLDSKGIKTTTKDNKIAVASTSQHSSSQLKPQSVTTMSDEHLLRSAKKRRVDQHHQNVNESSHNMDSRGFIDQPRSTTPKLIAVTEGFATKKEMEQYVLDKWGGTRESLVDPGTQDRLITALERTNQTEVQGLLRYAKSKSLRHVEAELLLSGLEIGRNSIQDSLMYTMDSKLDKILNVLGRFESRITTLEKVVADQKSHVISNSAESTQKKLEMLTLKQQDLIPAARPLVREPVLNPYDALSADRQQKLKSLLGGNFNAFMTYVTNGKSLKEAYELAKNS